MASIIAIRKFRSTESVDVGRRFIRPPTMHGFVEPVSQSHRCATCSSQGLNGDRSTVAHTQFNGQLKLMATD